MRSGVLYGALAVALLSAQPALAAPDAGVAQTGGSTATAGEAAPPPAPLTVSLDGGMPLKYDDRLCVTCHNKLVDRKSRHSQLKDGNCWDCHLPASRASECQGIGVGSTKTVEKNRTGSFSMEVSVVGWRLKESEPKLCQRCHEGIATDGEIHGAISKGGCAVCHDPHSSDLKKELKAPPEKLCATCHRRDDRKFRHAPVESGDCMACHDPHSGLDKPLLKDERKNLCEGCHEKKKLSVAKHKTAKSGGCFDCHQAHSTDEAFLIKPKPGTNPAPVTEGAPYPDAPCAECHKALTAKKFRHTLFKDGACGDCHVPSDKAGDCPKPVGKGWQLKQREPELCLKCHDGLASDMAWHKVVTMRGCTACHDPHSSDYKKELKAPPAKLCYQCHARKDSGLVTHAVVVRGQCIGCHDPHNGLARHLLKDEPGAVCAECHDAKKLMPNLQQHAPVAKARCPECHDPHGSSQKAMLVASGKDLCLKCHLEGAKGPDGKPAAQSQLVIKGPVSVHDPLKNDDCQACHVQTHSAKEKKLLRQGGARLCLKCHDGLVSNTPLHQPIETKGCVACHQPHTSTNKKLLKKWPVEALCHDCHEKKKTRETLSNVHTPVKEGKCLDCHDAHSGEEAPLLKLSRAELCFDCHPAKDLAKMPVVHTAVKEGRCLDCHDAHASNSRKMLVAEGTALCMRCHDAAKPDRDVMAFARVDMTKKVVHKPLLEKDCMACHEVGHSAKAKKMLKAPPRTLCPQCHERKDKTASVHAAVKLGDCSVCHQPHSSDQKNLAPWVREAKVCFECHDDDVSARAVIHKPVAEGKCNKCHDPHGSPFQGNLKVGPGRELCLKCHDKVKVDVKFKHKPVERYGCTGCHDPHGAANQALLTKTVNELCNGCHRDKSDGQHVSTLVRGGHIVKGDSDPRRQDRDFSCASCHNPHGSDNPKHFYFGRDGFEMCDGCHGDRSGANPGLQDISKKKRPPLPDGGIPRSEDLRPPRPVAVWLLPDEPELLVGLGVDGGTPSAGTPHPGPMSTLSPGTAPAGFPASTTVK